MLNEEHEITVCPAGIVWVRRYLTRYSLQFKDFLGGDNAPTATYNDSCGVQTCQQTYLGTAFVLVFVGGCMLQSKAFEFAILGYPLGDFSLARLVVIGSLPPSYGGSSHDLTLIW